MRTLIVVVVVSVALAGCGGTGQKSPQTKAATSSASAVSTASPAQSALQSCVEAWNNTPDPVWRHVIAYDAQGLALFATLGVYNGVVGSCAFVAPLLSSSNGNYTNVPGSGVAQYAVLYYTCTNGEAGWCQGQSVPENALPANATQWNAHVSSDGSIGLGVPPATTQSQASSTATTTTASTTTSGFGGCPAGEDRNDSGYCIPVSDPGPTCAQGESPAACGPAGRGPGAP